MGVFTEYVRNKIIDHVLGKTAFTMPTIYVALSSTNPSSSVTEPSGGSYARVATSGATWNAASSGATTNAAAISFPLSTASWGNMAYFALYDAASSGNMIGYGTLTDARNVNAADILVSFAAGELDVTLTST